MCGIYISLGRQPNDDLASDPARHLPGQVMRLFVRVGMATIYHNHPEQLQHRAPCHGTRKAKRRRGRELSDVCPAPLPPLPLVATPPTTFGSGH